MDTKDLPTYQDFMLPVLEILSDENTLSKKEIKEKIIQKKNLQMKN